MPSTQGGVRGPFEYERLIFPFECERLILRRTTVGIITWIVFGLIAGLIAKLLMPGRDPGGFIITILLGIAGALVGGFVATGLGFGGVDGFNIGSFAVAVLGSIILLIGYRLLKRNS